MVVVVVVVASLTDEEEKEEREGERERYLDGKSPRGRGDLKRKQVAFKLDTRRVCIYLYLSCQSVLFQSIAS